MMICDCEDCMRPIYALCKIGQDVYGLCPGHAATMVMVLARLSCWYAALGVPKPEMRVLSQAQASEPEVVV